MKEQLAAEHAYRPTPVALRPLLKALDPKKRHSTVGYVLSDWLPSPIPFPPRVTAALEREKIIVAPRRYFDDRECKACREEFEPTSSSQVYCATCGPIMRETAKRLRAERRADESKIPPHCLPYTHPRYQSWLLKVREGSARRRAREKAEKASVKA